MRIGILGGTFDPIHFGHIRPALEVKQALNLDKVWLMPNHIPPHKQGISAVKHRLTMVKQVCDKYHEFELCDIEVSRDTPSYSANTLDELTKRYPTYHFVFIMGTDSLLSLPTWYQYQKLFDLCDIAVTRRPDYSATTCDELQTRYALPEQFSHARNGRIFHINVTPQPFSSTEVRQNMSESVSKNNLISSALLPETEAYIKQFELY
ncbi:MAG: nicotinate (nicotinamide) nucleotide adenylyltransferase [Parashewanella sp.]